MYKAGQHFRNSSRDCVSGNFIVCVQKRDRPPVLFLISSLGSSFRIDFVYPLVSETDCTIGVKIALSDENI